MFCPMLTKVIERIRNVIFITYIFIINENHVYFFLNLFYTYLYTYLIIYYNILKKFGREIFVSIKLRF